MTQTQVSQVMTRGVRTLTPKETVQLAAQAMDELNVGAIPVCDGDRLVGRVTDRDITVRGVAQGRPADSTPLSRPPEPDRSHLSAASGPAGGGDASGRPGGNPS